MEGGEGSGVNILPANLMSMSSEDKADTSKGMCCWAEGGVGALTGF